METMYPVKMSKHKDLSEFDMDQIAMARLTQWSGLAGCSVSKWSKEVVDQGQGHGQPRLIDARGERRLAHVVRSSGRAAVAQIVEDMKRRC